MLDTARIWWELQKIIINRAVMWWELNRIIANKNAKSIMICMSHMNVMKTTHKLCTHTTYHNPVSKFKNSLRSIFNHDIGGNSVTEVNLTLDCSIRGENERLAKLTGLPCHFALKGRFAASYLRPSLWSEIMWRVFLSHHSTI